MEELYEELHALKGAAGDFACSGYVPKLSFPGLFIENVGDISLPIRKEQANEIIAVAQKAPFGLGEKTLIDESVRKSWQLDPKQITIKNKLFNQGIKKVVAAVKEQLGCNDKAVRAYLYKVLLYEKDGHFKPHRDTEKEDRMFATMIVQLPSVFEGGKLIVKHRGKVKEVQFDGEESSYCCKYAGHYSDCEHEVTKITRGYRLALVYSLCWNATGAPAPTADANAVVVENIAKILPSICTEERKKFFWFLDHKYSSAGLSGNGKKALKGHDAAVVNTLQAANELLPDEEKFDFYIAMVSRELEQYGARCVDRLGIGPFEPNGDEDELISVGNEWHTLNGAKQRMGSISVHFENEVVNYYCPPDMNSENYKEEFWGEADEEEYNEPTGNTGASQSYWYKLHAIFAWPKANSVHIMCESGYEAALDWLANEFTQVKNLPITHPSYQKVMANLKAVLNFAVTKRISVNRDVVCPMLTILVGLRSEASELTNLFLTDVMAKEVSQYSRSNVKSRYCLGDDAIIPSLVRLAVAVGWQSISDAILKMFHLSPVSQFGRWAVFLKMLLENMKENRNTALGENECFKSLLVSLVDAVGASAISKTLDSKDAIAWVGKTAALLFLFSDTDLLNKFTDAVLAYSSQLPNSSLLEKLIETLSSEDLGASPFWLNLLQARIKQLEEVEHKEISPFSWKQEDAVIDDHPQVQAFLRGPKQILKYQAFNGVKHARNWADEHFGNSSLSNTTSSRMYSANVTTTGTGQKAYALIEKTRAWYDEKVIAFQHKLKDLSKLRAMVKVLANNEDLTSEELEPAPKRRAVATICIA